VRGVGSGVSTRAPTQHLYPIIAHVVGRRRTWHGYRLSGPGWLVGHCLWQIVGVSPDVTVTVSLKTREGRSS